MTNKEKNDQDVIFNAALASDYVSDAFEMVVNEPDFWITASRWLGETNKPHSEGETYSLNEQKVSRIISLLTAQPANPACDEPYESFVLGAHDFLLTASSFMLNAKKEAAMELKNHKVRMPSKPVTMSFSADVSPSDFMNSIESQLSKSNKWSLGQKELAMLSMLSQKGEFPISIIDPENLYFNSTNASKVPSIDNIANKDQISDIMGCLINPQMLEVLFDAAADRMYPGSGIKFIASDYLPEEVIAIGVDNDDFKRMFSIDWKSFEVTASDKIEKNVSDLLPSVPIYTKVMDPLTEYKDPDVKSRSSDSIGLGI